MQPNQVRVRPLTSGFCDHRINSTLPKPVGSYQVGIGGIASFGKYRSSRESLPPVFRVCDDFFYESCRRTDASEQATLLVDLEERLGDGVSGSMCEKGEKRMRGSFRHVRLILKLHNHYNHQDDITPPNTSPRGDGLSSQRCPSPGSLTNTRPAMAPIQSSEARSFTPWPTTMIEGVGAGWAQ